jgi:hypothetical protein
MQLLSGKLDSGSAFAMPKKKSGGRKAGLRRLQEIAQQTLFATWYFFKPNSVNDLQQQGRPFSLADPATLLPVRPTAPTGQSPQRLLRYCRDVNPKGLHGDLLQGVLSIQRLISSNKGVSLRRRVTLRPKIETHILCSR